jgi:hypothetical protein
LPKIAIITLAPSSAAPDRVDVGDVGDHVLFDVVAVDDRVELEHDVKVGAPTSNAAEDRQLVNPALKK